MVGWGGDRAAFADHLSNGPYRWGRFDKTTASGLGRGGLFGGSVRGWVGWGSGSIRGPFIKWSLPVGFLSVGFF